MAQGKKKLIIEKENEYINIIMKNRQAVSVPATEKQGIMELIDKN